MNKASERIAELRAANLPRCDWRTFLGVSNPTCPCCEPDAAALEGLRPLDEYFRHFLPPGPCVCCGAKQVGGIVESLLGTTKFTWGMVHGEGFCADCKYPARAYHRDVGPIKFLPMILQYHPDELTTRTTDRTLREPAGA